MKNFFKVFLVVFLFLFSFFSYNNIVDGYYYQSELEATVNKFDEINFVNDANDYRIHDMIVVDNYYLVLGEEVVYATNYNYNCYPYIALYLNNSLVFSKTLTTYGYGNFITGLIESKELIVLGAFEDSYGVSQMHIFKFALNGTVIDRYYSYANNNTFPKQIFNLGGYYYVFGSTYATNLCGSTLSSNKGFLFAARFDSSFKVDYYDVFGNNGVNVVYQTVLINNYFFLYTYMSKDGYYPTNSYGFGILCLDSHLEKYSYTAVDTIGENFLVNYFGKIALLSYNRNYNEVVLRVYDLTLDLIEMKEKSILKSMFYSVDVSFSYTSDSILMANVCRNGSETRVLCQIYDQNFNVVFEANEPIDPDRLYDDCVLADGWIYLYGVNNGLLFGDRLLNLQLIGSELYFNGLLSTKTYELNQDNIFGVYPTIVTYKLGYVEVEALINLYIEPVVNIKSSQVYDVNLTLSFNGVGYLNNKPIQNNHVITQTGSYILEVKGKNESVYYTFDVESLCSDLSEMKTIKQVKIVEVIEPDNPNKLNLISYAGNISIPNQNEENLIPLFVVLASISLIVGFLFAKRKKHA